MFSQFGLPGLVIGLQCVWIWRLDKRYQALTEAYMAEADARVQDAKAFNALSLDLQAKVIESVATIGNLFHEHDQDVGNGSAEKDHD